MAKRESLERYVGYIEREITQWTSRNSENPCKLVVGLYSYSAYIDSFVSEVLKHQGYEVIAVDFSLLEHVKSSEQQDFVIKLMNEASEKAKSMKNPLIQIERMDLLDNSYLSPIELWVETGPFFKNENDDKRTYIPFFLTGCNEFFYNLRTNMTDYFYVADSALDYSPVAEKLFSANQVVRAERKELFKQEQIKGKIREATSWNANREQQKKMTI
jgi:hypothetical protein